MLRFVGDMRPDLSKVGNCVNMLGFVLLVAVAICVAEASPDTGPAAPHNGYESSVNKNNAARQLGVNTRANWVGAGTGTAYRDGVPGTPLGVTGHDRYSYGHGHRYGGYGHGGYGGYGHGAYSRGGYGHGGYGGYGGYGY